MKKTTSLKYILIAPIILIIFTSCSQEPSSTPTKTNPQQIETPAPVLISQWAIAAASNVEPEDAIGSNSLKATGEKLRVDTCAKDTANVYSWTSKEASWLEVYFETPVYPTELLVFQDLNPNLISKIELLDLQGGYHLVYEGNEHKEKCPFQFRLDVSDSNFEVIGARISITDSKTGTFGIDAVQITGVASEKTNTFGTPTPLPGTPTPIPAAIEERSYSDRPDDYPGLYQFHVVYLLFKEQNDKGRDIDGSIAASIHLANEWVKKQTGGSSLRFDTYQNELDITYKELGITKKQFLDNARTIYDREHSSNPGLAIEDYYIYWIDQKREDLNLNIPGKYYIIYLEIDHSNACGQSYLSYPLGLFFLETDYCGYGNLGADKYAWETEFVLIHELLHGIGFVPECAPHNKDSHILDSSNDLMFSYVGRGQQAILDVGNDDYFNHNIPNCPDLADSAFLMPLPENAQAPTDWPDESLLPK